MRTLLIDPEFQKLLPPLSPDCYATLEEGITKDGCNEPLVTWDGVLVDGHNRYEICTRHDIGFDTREMHFADRDAAMDWIDMNQVGRRNLNPDAVRLAIGRRYNRMKKAQGAPQGNDNAEKQMGNSYPSVPRTSAQLAAQHNVSEKTVRNAGKFAEEVESTPELQQAIAEGKPIQKVRKEMAAAKEQEEGSEPARKIAASKPDKPKPALPNDCKLGWGEQIGIQATMALDRMRDDDEDAIMVFESMIKYCNKRLAKIRQ